MIFFQYTNRFMKIKTNHSVILTILYLKVNYLCLTVIGRLW